MKRFLVIQTAFLGDAVLATGLLEKLHAWYPDAAIDLVVLPSWRAVLPVGTRRLLPVWTHPQLLRDPAAIRPLAEQLLRP